jgi:penicillin-insensitive murein DD-endopeptidase
MIKPLRIAVLSVLAITFLAGTAHVPKKDSDPLANKLFGAQQRASKQKPRVLGYYAKGCVAGAQQLPETGPTWQAMRLSRNRNWGHPALIDFIKRLSQSAVNIGWKGIYVGDMAQPRGGPMTTAHASHQNGLDADIWLLPPKRLNLSKARRETISSLVVRSADQRSVTKDFSPSHMALLKAAAQDKAVDRIFVAAAVKIEMCRTAGKDRKWLAKVRPLYGHESHFHVRLKCPKGERNCVKQKPKISQISKGDGCDKTLEWWVTDYLVKPKVDPNKKKIKKKVQPKPRPRRARQMIMADLPRQCASVLNSQ